MGKFAQNTEVTVDRSRAEVESIIRRYGADAFGYWTDDGQAVIEFQTNKRRVRFILPLPKKENFASTPGRGRKRGADGIASAWEQACRQKWRALVLAIKAKLESVDSEIETLEEAFMANIVDPVSNRTVGEIMSPQIERAYAGKPGQLLIAPPSKP